MATNFTVPLNGRDPVGLLKKAQAEAAQHKIALVGDERGGEFTGRGVKGSYAVTISNVVVTVDEKPFFLPMSIVESAVHELFG